MHKPQFTRQEKQEIRAAKLAEALHGEGLYIYKNPSKQGTLTLPRPTRSGLRHVGPEQEFQGDNYYMQMVKTHELRLIKELVSPEAERKAMEQEKLLLDQPDTVTSEGTVEHVVKQPKVKQQKLNDHAETKQSKQTPDTLINEDPMAGVEIILG